MTPFSSSSTYANDKSRQYHHHNNHNSSSSSKKRRKKGAIILRGRKRNHHHQHDANSHNNNNNITLHIYQFMPPHHIHPKRKTMHSDGEHDETPDLSISIGNACNQPSPDGSDSSSWLQLTQQQLEGKLLRWCHNGVVCDRNGNQNMSQKSSVLLSSSSESESNHHHQGNHVAVGSRREEPCLDGDAGKEGNQSGDASQMVSSHPSDHLQNNDNVAIGTDASIAAASDDDASKGSHPIGIWHHVTISPHNNHTSLLNLMSEIMGQWGPIMASQQRHHIQRNYHWEIREDGKCCLKELANSGDEEMVSQQQQQQYNNSNETITIRLWRMNPCDVGKGVLLLEQSYCHNINDNMNPAAEKMPYKVSPSDTDAFSVHRHGPKNRNNSSVIDNNNNNSSSSPLFSSTTSSATPSPHHLLSSASSQHTPLTQLLQQNCFTLHKSTHQQQDQFRSHIDEILLMECSMESGMITTVEKSSHCNQDNRSMNLDDSSNVQHSNNQATTKHLNPVDAISPFPSPQHNDNNNIERHPHEWPLDSAVYTLGGSSSAAANSIHSLSTTTPSSWDAFYYSGPRPYMIAPPHHNTSSSSLEKISHWVKKWVPKMVHKAGKVSTSLLYNSLGGDSISFEPHENYSMSPSQYYPHSPSTLPSSYSPSSCSPLTPLSPGTDLSQKFPHPPGTRGLQNLGNTCFMNASLQCLSHTTQLTEYFLQLDYTKHINTTNPLGMKGKLAKAYAKLLHKLWTPSARSKAVSPFKFKRTLSHFAPQFSGMRQHDAHELLSFLLDGLHEDLNRVKDKPYVELKEANGRDDHVVSKEAWEDHLRRNQSIIVDTFQALLKSTLVCPDCKCTRVRFEPFMYLPLSVPASNLRHLSVFYMHSNPNVVGYGLRPVKYSIPVTEKTLIGFVKKKLADLLQMSSNDIILADMEGYCIHHLLSDKEIILNLKTRDKILCFHKDKHSRRANSFKRDHQSSGIHGSASETNGSGASHSHPQTEGGHDIDHHRHHHRHHHHHHHHHHRHSRSILLRCCQTYSTVADQDPHSDSEHVYELHPFGIPFLLFVPTQLSGAELYDLVHRYVSRYTDASLHPPKGHKYHFQLSLKSDPFSLTTRSQLVEPLRDTVLNFPQDEKNLCIEWISSAFFLDQASTVSIHKESVYQARKESEHELSITDCLRLFSETEQLSADDVWYCSQCKEHKEAYKKFAIWSLPDVLIINIKRFYQKRYRWYKMTMMIDFPIDELDMSSFLVDRNSEEGSSQHSSEDGSDPTKRGHSATNSGGSDSSQSTSSSEKSTHSDSPVDAKYELFGVVNHSGTLNSGHYTSYAKNTNNGRWYHYNDSIVREVQDVRGELISNRACILFYKRKASWNPSQAVLDLDCELKQ